MRRMTLTPATKIAYANPIAAKSAVGFSSSFKNTGAQAPSNPSVLFLFAPEGLFYGGMRGETFGSAGLSTSVRRSANPAYAVTNLFSSEWCRFVTNEQLVTLMSTLFVLRDGISPKECRDYIRIYAFQAQALTQLIDEALGNCCTGEISTDIHDRLG